MYKPHEYWEFYEYRLIKGKEAAYEKEKKINMIY